ncbi:MAG: trypsin-like peptidase domain-containing protein [Deltaproteobacteria bacterium]|nr:trypsin-like peptidase domain-containing protein [Deltaproteobacteria bacterium]
MNAHRPQAFSCPVLVALAVCLLGAVCQAGERVELTLTTGDRVEGELLRRDAGHLYLLVGESLLEIEASKVEKMHRVKERPAGTSGEVRKHGLYATAQRSIREVPQLVAELGPAIVVVKTPTGLGTGWFCNPDGFLITNHHVVAGERSIRVTMFPREGKSLGRKVFRKVRIIAQNADMDLALLKVEEKLDVSIPQLYLGEFSRVQVGDKAFAIGNPMGLERSTSEGIVSKVARNIGGRLFVQTTAPIAPGNSGGPLFNARGEVIGVVARGAIVLDGLGFAIPSTYVKEFLDHVEAFAYDEDNPNTGVQYMETPVSSSDGRIRFAASDFIKMGHGLTALAVGDLDRDRIDEAVFADNNKSEIAILRRRKRKDARPSLQDEWDINQLPESEHFRVETIPVQGRVSSLALGDLNGDKRCDVVFYGGIEKLAVLEQTDRGDFSPPRRLAEFDASGIERAVRVLDVDGDGQTDVLALGGRSFTVLWNGRDRRDYPLNASIVSKVKDFDLIDADGDKLLDVVFFVNSGHYGAYLRRQAERRAFVEEIPLRQPISGPVRAYQPPEGRRFLTLDMGKNRIRELRFSAGSPSRRSGGLPDKLVAVPVGAGGKAEGGLHLHDVDGDRALEMLTFDSERNELILLDRTNVGFRASRSPAPEKLDAALLYRSTRGRAVVFSYSRSEKLFGGSRIESGRISFPRPFHTQGEVQLVQMEEVDGRTQLIWVEKVGSGFEVRRIEADAAADAVYDGPEGAVDLGPKTLRFGSDSRSAASLSSRPTRFGFADFDGDAVLDLIIFWAYSGKESLYLGAPEDRYLEVIREKSVIQREGEQEHALLFEDLDGDGRRDVLQVMPGFIRILKVDAKGRLFVKAQYNWDHGPLLRFVRFDSQGKKTRFAAVAGNQASLVHLDSSSRRFELEAQLDLSGLDIGLLAVGDVDGDARPDLVTWGKGVVLTFLSRAQGRSLEASTRLNASLSHFAYWELVPADLNRDGRDEVLLFDSKKNVMEILEQKKDAAFHTIMRHRLFERHLIRSNKPGKNQAAQPSCVEIGDLDGNGKPDLVFLLHDRLAVFLQDGRRARSRSR